MTFRWRQADRDWLKTLRDIVNRAGPDNVVVVRSSSECKFVRDYAGIFGLTLNVVCEEA